MSLTYNSSIDDLKDYCLRALGHPVINIEVHDDQCYDRISDAIIKFQDRHYAGTVEKWEVVQVTEDDVSRGYVTLSSDWGAVIDLIDPLNNNPGSGDDFDNLNFRIANSDIFTQVFQNGDGGMLSWQVFHEKLELIKRFFTPTRRFRFNHLTHQLDLQGTWTAGYLFVVHGYKKVTPEETVDVYNEDFIKRYSTALIGRQWGVNISKYDGIQMPGGVTMNGAAIYERYDKMVSDIDESFSSKYELPVDFQLA